MFLEALGTDDPVFVVELGNQLDQLVHLTLSQALDALGRKVGEVLVHVPSKLDLQSK